jgi:Holliday junction resolvase RusA-like endonuclease
MIWTPQLRVFIPGIAAPQGSKKGVLHKHTKKIILLESSKFVKPWRAQVVEYCSGRIAKLDEAVHVDVQFWFDRPKTVKTPYPIGNQGDIDKLLRSTYDGLVMAQVMRDDRLIVGGEQYKDFTPEGEESGAYVTVLALRTFADYNQVKE